MKIKHFLWLSFRYYLVAQIKMMTMNLPLDFSVPSNFPDLAYDISTNPPTEKDLNLVKTIL
jgi:cytochrome c peroxidase